MCVCTMNMCKCACENEGEDPTSLLTETVRGSVRWMKRTGGEGKREIVSWMDRENRYTLIAVSCNWVKMEAIGKMACLSSLANSVSK